MNLLRWMLLLSLVGCGMFKDMRTADRSRLNAAAMNKELFSDLSTVSPLTGLRSAGTQSGGGCSSCAH